MIASGKVVSALAIASAPNRGSAASCEKIFTDTMSGTKAERPGLTEVLDFCRPGDTLVVPERFF